VHESSIIFLLRRISNIRGFSRETLVALVANLESQLAGMEKKVQHGLAPEHPRASTTDDVECFFFKRQCWKRFYTQRSMC